MKPGPGGLPVLVLKVLLVLLMLVCKSLADAAPDAPSTGTVVTRVACVGDSITFGAGIEDRERNSYPVQLQEMLGGAWEARNFGVSARTLLKKGDYPYGAERAYRDALAFLPHVVVIQLGTNDVKPQNWAHKSDFVSDYLELIASFQRLETHPQVYVCVPVPGGREDWGIAPQRIREELPPLVREVAKKAGLPVIDLYAALLGRDTLFPDKVHPNAKGAGVMAKAVFDGLTRGPRGKVLCIGDSITYGTYIGGVYTADRSWVQFLGQKSGLIQTVNAGSSGRDTSDRNGVLPILARNKDATHVLFFLGVNDLDNGDDRKLEGCVTNMRWMIEQARKQIPAGRILLLAPCDINPRTVTPHFRSIGYDENTEKYLRLLAPRYEELAKREGIGYVSLVGVVSPENYNDGIHPDLKGQQQIADAVWTVMKMEKQENSAVIPAQNPDPAQAQEYDWPARHEQVKERIRRKPVDLIFLGDSITHYFAGEPEAKYIRGAEAWKRYYDRRNAVNMGFGWDRTEHLLWRLDNGEAEGIAPKAAVLLIGTNNLPHNTVEETAQGIERVCGELRRRLPRTRILLLGILPRGESPEDPMRAKIRRVNSIVSKLDDGEWIRFLNAGARFLDSACRIPASLAPDFLHPSAEGYRVLAESLEPILAEWMGDKAP